MKIPYCITWNITNRCSLQCLHCRLPFNKGRDELDFDKVTEVIDILSKNKVFMISFGGGEPFARDDFIEILKYTDSKKIVSLIATNGLMMDSCILRKLHKSKVSCIAVSLDSSVKQIHEKIRGLGTFDKTVGTIRSIKTSGIGLVISIALMRENMHSLRETLEFAYRLGAEKIKIQYVVKHNQEGGISFAMSKNELKNTFYVIKDFLLRYRLSNYVRFNCYCGYLSLKLGDALDQVPCAMGRNKAVMQSTGDIIPCELYSNIIVGNVFNQPLVDIWKKLKKITHADKNRKLIHYCEKCHYVKNCKGGCKRFSVCSEIDSSIFSDQCCFIKDA